MILIYLKFADEVEHLIDINVAEHLLYTVITHALLDLIAINEWFLVKFFLPAHHLYLYASRFSKCGVIVNILQFHPSRRRNFIKRSMTSKAKR